MKPRKAVPGRSQTRQPGGRCLPCITAIAVLIVAAGTTATAVGQTINFDDTGPRPEDLIRLSTEYSEALGEARVAELRAETLKRLRASVVVTDLEVKTAEIDYQTAQNKVRLLRKITEAQLAAAQSKLETLRQLSQMMEPDETPTAIPAAVMQAEAAVEILQMILDLEKAESDETSGPAAP